LNAAFGSEEDYVSHVRPFAGSDMQVLNGLTLSSLDNMQDEVVIHGNKL